MNRWRVGEDRGSKETDGCPLTQWERTMERVLIVLDNRHKEQCSDMGNNGY
jgi:hypothetical protein